MRVNGESGRSFFPAGSVVIREAAFHPILIRGKDFHGKGAGARPLTVRISAIRLAGDWIRRGYVRERKAAFDKQVILPIALGASRLRPTVIQIDAVGGGDPLHHAVEDLLAILRLIETQIAEVVQEAAGLRNHLGIDPGDVARKRIGRRQSRPWFRSEAMRSSREPPQGLCHSPWDLSPCK